MTWLLGAPVQPFVIAAVVLLALVFMEAVGALLVGTTPSQSIDASPVGEFLDSTLGWLNLGKVPFLVLVIILLALFSMTGIVLQSLATSLANPLPIAVAVPVAAVLSVLGTRNVSRLVSGVFPRDETYAVTDQDLIGLVGIVTVGPLESRVVGRICVSDRHGNKHFPRARPSAPADIIQQGAEVLIVDQVGREYRVIAAPVKLSNEA